MNSEEHEISEKKSIKKKRNWFKGLLIFILVVIIIVIILGFLFPGLLWVKDLGVRYSKADYDNIMNKLNYIKDATPIGDDANQYQYIYGDVKDVDIEFTSEEITAFFNEGRPSYYAIKNVQIKLNDDGSVEAVGSANVDYFLTNILSGKYSKAEIEKQMPALGILPSNVNLYLKFSGSVNNNISNINIASVSVQGIPIPSNILDTNEATSTVTDGLNNLIKDYNNKSGSSFDKIAVENKKVIFKGKIPTSLERIEE